MIIYTDGSNVYNGKPYSYGGFGYVIVDGDDIIEGGQSMPVNKMKPVTNNRAELNAIIHALDTVLSSMHLPSHITLYSDSQWCVKCGNGEWGKKKNIDLWAKYNKMVKALRDRDVVFELVWVKGHAGIELNERADGLAGWYCAQAKP